MLIPLFCKRAYKPEKGSKMDTIVRYIKSGKRTAKHLEILRSKGYEVEENEEGLVIQASEVVEGTVDLSSPEAAQKVLGDTIAASAVFSYQTKFKFPDGKVLYGVMACTRLGKASALVTKGEPKEKVAKVNAVNDIFDAL